MRGALDQLIGGLYRPPSTEGAPDTTSLVMCRTHALWVMSLFASGCTMAGTGHDTAYSPRPLQSNNCGTPYQFKACESGSRVACCQRTGVGAVQRSKSLVVIEKLTGPAREAATPGSYDLMDYSRSSVPDPASLTPVLGSLRRHATTKIATTGGGKGTELTPCIPVQQLPLGCRRSTFG